MPSPRRRDLLGLAAGTGSALLAGCLSDSTGTESTTSDDESGDDPASTSDGTTSDPSSSGPTATVDDVAVTTWTPSPPFGGSEEYFAFYVDATALANVDLSEQATSRLDRLFVGIPPEILSLGEVNEAVAIGSGGGAATYDVGTATLRERLAAAAAEGSPNDRPAGTATGPRTVTASDDENATAASDGDASSDDETAGEDAETTTEASGPAGYEAFATPRGYYWLGADHVLFAARESYLSRMYETARGDAPSYASDADLEAVLDAVGDVDVFGGRIGSQDVVDGAAAFGYAWTFDDAASLTAAFAFESAGAVETSGLDALQERAGFAEYENVTTAVDGRVATLSGSLPVSEFDVLARDDGGEGTGTGKRPTPSVQFGFEFNKGKDGEWNGGADERVVVTHEGGDTVDLDDLTVRYGDTVVAETDDVNATMPTGESWSAGGELILRAGATMESFESGADLELVWTSDDGESALVIAAATLP